MMPALPVIRLDLVFVLAGSSFFGFLWALSALNKILNRILYRDQLRDYQVVPDSLVTSVAGVLLAAEMGLALSCLFDVSRTQACLWSAILLLSYAAAMGYNLMQGRRHIACGCGGEGQEISWALVWRNGVIALLAVVLSLAQVDVIRPLSFIDVITIAGAALALYGAYLVFNQLLANAAAQSLAH